MNASVATDPTRSGLRAVPLPPDTLHTHSDHGGVATWVSDGVQIGVFLACPGCGWVSAMRAGDIKPAHTPSWRVAFGSLYQPTGMSLRPSINCVGCCGWHGWLTRGVFHTSTPTEDL